MDDLVQCAERVARFLAQRPDLLQPRYRRLVESGARPLTGHCYVATEALYHLGAKGDGYRPHWVKVGDDSHWFLKDALDPTLAQFPEGTVDHQAGRCTGFLTRQPSRRCQVVPDALRG